MIESSFVESVGAAISAHRLLVSGKPVIVAVSGGADSVALLVALCALGYECVAAHCNFHLRGEESNRDMRHVQQLCSRLGVDLYVRDFDVEARRNATGESVEMACRELRYAWFADLLDKQRAQAIAVAHHREDNVETFFLNLMRGSGIAGLAGMKPCNGYVVRPLLSMSRSDIEAYLAAEKIEFVTDSTNAQNDYARNKLRNVIIPSLVEQFPNSLSGILASMAYLGDNKSLYDAMVKEKAARYFVGNKIDLRELTAAEGECARMLLFEMIRPYGFNMAQAYGMLNGLGRSGQLFVSGESAFSLDRGVLSLESSSIVGVKDDETIVSLERDILSPVHIVISEHQIADFRPERNQNVAYFDADMLNGNAIYAIRHWRRGDRMAPYGMNGTKLISDLFASAKYGAKEKRNAWLLTRDGEVIWAVGLRASRLFSLKPETRRYLRLELRQ